MSKYNKRLLEKIFAEALWKNGVSGMSKSALKSDQIIQIGIIVRDIEQASKTWASFLGVDNPGWSQTGELKDAQTEYRGKPTAARAKLAFFEMGNVQIELIEPDEQPSTWREFLDSQGEGVHHLAFGTEAMGCEKKSLASAGIELVQKGEYKGGRYSYFDSYPQLKVMLELLEND